MKRDLRKKFLVIWLILLATFIALYLFLMLIGQIDLFNTPKFGDLSLCSIDIDSSVQTNKHTFLEGEDIILCGRVESSVPTDLTIILFVGSDQDPVFNEGIYQIKDGNFSYKLSLGKIPIGQYLIEVYNGRDFLADLGFKIFP